MLLVCCLLSAAISNSLWVSAHTPIIIGQNTTIPANETASTAVRYTDPPPSHPENEDWNEEAEVYFEYPNGKTSLDYSNRNKRDTANATCEGFSQLNSTQIVKKVFKYGGSKIPACFVKTGFDALVELFWPEMKLSVWDEILETIKISIDPITFNSTRILLTCQISQFKRHIKELARKINEGHSDISQYYMYVVQDIAGLEKEFVTGNPDPNNKKQLNKNFLPLYSNIVLLKAAFYTLGMKCQRNTGLTDQNVANISTHFNETLHFPVNGANDHIFQIMKGEDTSISEYGRVMWARNIVKEHGYVPIWENMFNNPGKKLVIDEVLYSGCLGNICELLTPPSTSDVMIPTRLSDGRYNKITKLTVYHKPTNCNDTVVGMTMLYENGETSEFGQKSFTYRVIELNSNRRIHKMRLTWDMFENNWVMTGFIISLIRLEGNDWVLGKEVYTFGCISEQLKTDFEYENYYISSIIASFGDVRSADYPFLNMAVSYLPMKSSQVDNATDAQNWKEWVC